MFSIKPSDVRKLLITFLIISTVGLVNAQQISSNITRDSILKIFEKAQSDINKVNLLNELTLVISRSDMPNNLMQYASEALLISQKERYQKGIGISYYAMGFYNYAKKNHIDALSNLTQAQIQFDAIADKQNGGRCKYLTANILFDKGDYAGSIKNCTDALQLWQSSKYKTLIGACCNDLALFMPEWVTTAKVWSMLTKDLRLRKK
ncbi:MAG: hypothetical protein IPP48_04480 [Chitinophagaceae bacterium]|nr:hypothetical protein [Chitinophagaceae bacterium]